jgi:hypothetical protein
MKSARLMATVVDRPIGVKGKYLRSRKRIHREVLRNKPKQRR